MCIRDRTQQHGAESLAVYVAGVGPQYVHLHTAVDGQGGDEGLVGGAAVEHHPHHARHGELVDVGPLREHLSLIHI